MAKWFLKKPAADIGLMSQTLGVSPTLATVLANRGIKTKTEAVRYLKPQKEFMHDASSLKDIDKAIVAIVEAVSGGKTIAVYGDYDVDGVMSTVILYRFLKRYGANVIYCIPHREEDGYGLNTNAIDRLRDDNVDIILTCDNGIAAIQEIAYANTFGIETIVLDHHEPGFVLDNDGNKTEILPAAKAVIDAKQESCQYPFKALCAGGLSYKFVQYFHQYMELDFEHEDEYLIFACIATICDIVDLLDENRIIAKTGLDLMNACKVTNLGLLSLLEQRQLTNKTISAFDIGFILGPCVNASGRLESAATSVELFLSEDSYKASELASKLITLNEDRKNLTAKSVKLALEKISCSEMKEEKVVIFYEPEIHESIAGIVAGRVKEELYRPTIILTNSGDMVKGSGRSIEGYNLFEELNTFRDLFERFGGHAMAAGLTLKQENIPLLRESLNNACKLQESDFIPMIKIDAQIRLEDATFTLANELLRLEPFGKANKEPVFGTKNLVADSVEIIGTSRTTMRFNFTLVGSGRKIKAICFKQVDKFLKILEERKGALACERFLQSKAINIPMDIVYYIQINEYNENKYVNINIIDFRLM